MNPLQQAWLKVLSPISYFVNERLAKRSGLLGRIGRFFLIGPREYGVHPFNRGLIFINRRLLFAQAIMLHRYSVIKGATHNGYHMLRPLRTISFLPPLLILAGIARLLYPYQEFFNYNPDSLNYLMLKTGNNLQLPLNSLNQRTSAHYQQISILYQAEMLKRVPHNNHLNQYHRIHAEIIAERRSLPESQRKTRFADPSYKFEAAPAIHVPEFKAV